MPQSVARDSAKQRDPVIGFEAPRSEPARSTSNATGKFRVIPGVANITHCRPVREPAGGI